MHIVLAGPGALGCLLSSRLAGEAENSDYQLTLLDHNASRARQLSSQGVLYQHKKTSQCLKIPVSSSPSEIGPTDLVILCVKSYDILACLEFCKPLLRSGTLLLFMQNGIAHLAVDSHTGPATPAYATTTEGATLVSPGEVRHAGRGLTQLGFLGPVSAMMQNKLQKITAIFNNAGLKARQRDDILSRLWTKLLVNTGINGLTATLGCTNGELLTLPGAENRMTQLVEEAFAVATASEIDVPQESLEITRDVCRKTAGNISSMLQDVRAGRRTEIEAINGAVAAAGRELGVATPENDILVQQVKVLEESYLP